MLSESDYVRLAHDELVALLDALDALPGDDFEAELENDIITLEFSDDAKYVVNSHRAARQIWMAAERTAWHFDWDAGKNSWIAPKSGDELWAALRQTLEKKLGRPVPLVKA